MSDLAPGASSAGGAPIAAASLPAAASAAPAAPSFGAPLRRTLSAPAHLAPPPYAEFLLVQDLQIVWHAAGDVVAAVQAERASTKLELLAPDTAAALQAAVMTQLHRTGLTRRLANRLAESVPAAQMDALAGFFHGPNGVFYRTQVGPLAQDLEVAWSSWHAQRRAGVPKPSAATGERRRELDKVMPQVHAMVPGAVGDAALCDVLAAQVLLDLDRAGRRALRQYLAAIERNGFAAPMARLAQWAQEACIQEGILGWALARADALNDLEACNKAIALSRTAVPALRRRADLYLNRLDEPLKALRDTHRLVRLEPAPDHWVACATAYIALERYNEAEACLTEAMRLAPDGASAYGWRSILRLKRGNVAAAQRDLRRGERRDPHEPDVCRAKLQLDDYALTQRLAANPEDVEAYLQRAVCRGGQRQYSAALKDCRTALRLSPDNPEALAGCDLYASILGVDSIAG